MRIELRTFTRYVINVCKVLIVMGLLNYVSYIFTGDTIDNGGPFMIIYLIIYLFTPFFILYMDQSLNSFPMLLLKKYGLWVMIMTFSFFVLLLIIVNEGFSSPIHLGTIRSLEDIFFMDFMTILKIYFISLFHFKVLFTIGHVYKFYDGPIAILLAVVYAAIFMFAGPYIAMGLLAYDGQESLIVFLMLLFFMVVSIVADYFMFKEL